MGGKEFRCEPAICIPVKVHTACAGCPWGQQPAFLLSGLLSSFPVGPAWRGGSADDASTEGV